MSYNNKTYILNKSKYTTFSRDPNRKHHLDNILRQLEKDGVSIFKDRAISRYLSNRLREAKKREQIYFSWNKKFGKSIITMNPNFKIKLISQNKVRINKKP